MFVTMMIRKTDNGFRGVTENESSRGLFRKGEEIFNRQFHPYAKGTLLKVLVNISAKGRRMVKSVEVAIVSEIKIDMTPRTGMGAIEEMVKKMVETPAPEVAPEPAPTKAKAKVKTAGSGYYVSRESRLVFNTVLGMSNRQPERAVKVMMVGQSGYGKTTLPRLFAELSGKQFLRMNCATVRDPEEWFGYREAVGGSTQFIRSAFAKTLEAGNVVVVLDEFNRLEPWLHNTLFPLLDDDGCTVVHDEKFSIGKGVIVVGTINVGYKYTGVFELDEALMNRFEFILEVGPMPFEDEVNVLVARTGLDKMDAEQVVKVANILRQSDVVCSTRTSLLVANMIMSGLHVREAFETAVVKRIPVDASGSALRKQVVDLINVQLGPFEERSLKADIFNGPDAPAATVEKHHRLMLFQAPGKGINSIRAVQLLMRLDLKERMSLSKAKEFVDALAHGEQVTLTLNSKPTNLDEFTATGISGRYTLKGE